MKTEYTREQLADVLYKTKRGVCILANQNALAQNEVLQHTDGYKQRLKQLGTPFIKELIKLEAAEFERIEKAEKELDEFKGQNPINEAFEKSEKIISLLARMAFLNYDMMEDILYATALDPDSIHGIAKKINKNRKKQ